MFEDREKPNLFEKIRLWWKFDGKYYHKYLKQGIKNLWYWFPIIWKDRNWDQHYIFEVLKHKLKSQSEYIGRMDFHTRAQQDARNMRICIKLIQICQDDTYGMEYMDYHKDRIWFTPCEDRPDSSLMNSELVWEKFDDYFKKYPLIYKRVLKGEGIFSMEGRWDDKQVLAMNIAHINQKRAQDLLFKIMNNGINSWWD